MKHLKHNRSAVLLAISVALAGCGGGGGGSGTPGSTTPTGIGQAYYPNSIGNVWNMDGTTSDNGAAAVSYSDNLQVTGTQSVSGQIATIFQSSNPVNSGVPTDEYYVKSSTAFVYLGSNDATDWLSNAIKPFDLMRFDGTFSATPLLNKSGVSIGTDLDGDGIAETMDALVTGTVEGTETLVTPAGSFSNAARLRYDVSGTVRLSRGGSVPVSETVREWRAADVGLLKQTVTASSGSQSSSDTLVVRGLSVGGIHAGVMAPRALLSSLAAADSDTTNPGRVAVASDGTRFLVVSSRQVGGGHLWTAAVAGGDGTVQTVFDLSASQTSFAGTPAAASDGSNFMVLTVGDSGLVAQRVGATGVIDSYPGTMLASNGANPSVAYGAGTYLVVYRRSGAPATIYGQRLTAAGLSSGEFIVATNAADFAYPSVAWDGSNFLVAWESVGSSFAPQNTDIHAARVSTIGAVLDNPPIAVSQAPEAQFSPSVACDGSQCLVAWVDRRNYAGTSYSFSPGPGDMYGAFVTKAGLVLNGPPASGGLALATGISANQAYTALGFTGSDYLLAWSRGFFVNNPGGPTGIYAARVSTAGVSGTAINVSGAPEASAILPYPTLASAAGGSMLAWLNNRETSGATKSVNGAVIYPTASR